jgi:hypothetical protein
VAEDRDGEGLPVERVHSLEQRALEPAVRLIAELHGSDRAAIDQGRGGCPEEIREHVGQLIAAFGQLQRLPHAVRVVDGPLDRDAGVSLELVEESGQCGLQRVEVIPPLQGARIAMRDAATCRGSCAAARRQGDAGGGQRERAPSGNPLHHSSSGRYIGVLRGRYAVHSGPSILEAEKSSCRSSMCHACVRRMFQYSCNNAVPEQRTERGGMGRGPATPLGLRSGDEEVLVSAVRRRLRPSRGGQESCCSRREDSRILRSRRWSRPVAEPSSGGGRGTSRKGWTASEIVHAEVARPRLTRRTSSCARWSRPRPRRRRGAPDGPRGRSGQHWASAPRRSRGPGASTA